jgi:hypothetical protein
MLGLLVRVGYRAGDGSASTASSTPLMVSGTIVQDEALAPAATSVAEPAPKLRQLAVEVADAGNKPDDPSKVVPSDLPLQRSGSG